MQFHILKTECIPLGERVSFVVPATWATACHLQRIALAFVAGIDKFIMAEDSPQTITQRTPLLLSRVCADIQVWNFSPGQEGFVINSGSIVSGQVQNQRLYRE